MNFLEALKEVDNFTYTENGAGAYKSTKNDLLDAFGTLGAYCKTICAEDSETILQKFYRAFSQDKKLAIKMLFYLRDVRGGQGCRTLFRIIMHSLAHTYPEYVVNNFDNFLFFGRGDDLLYLLDTPIETEVINYLKKVFEEDLAAVKSGNTCSLLGKWLPSENASSKQTKYFANKLIKGFGIRPSQYRKSLTMLRKSINIVETLMSQNRWEEIDFEKLPSKASMIYSDAFFKHVQNNYEKYLTNLVVGDSKVNAGALFPVDIIHKVSKLNYNLRQKDIILNDAMWKALPNYFEEAGVDETGICVVDTSGSMSGTPLEVAISLGIYCADKAKGPFKNHFITFSRYPRLQEIKGNNIFEKYMNLYNADWEMNTNIEAVFDLILKTALKNHTPQEDMPNKLYIISDMQFDAAQYGMWHSGSKTDLSFIEKMKIKYEQNGYVLPALVYWNVRNSDCGMFQQTASDTQCCFVSGYSPSLFKSVLLGTEIEEVVDENGSKTTNIKLDPITIMNNTLNDERYDRVWVG